MSPAPPPKEDAPGESGRGRPAPGRPPAAGDDWLRRAPSLVALVGTLIPAPAGAQSHLPGDVELSGGIYLYHFAPLDVPDVNDRTEVYALYLNLDRSDGPWTVHVQGRWRDTKLRSFYPSNVWLQEGWVAYTLSPGATGAGEAGSAGGGRGATLTLRAGKLYQRLGRFWDGSFFGDIHYFDGLKLDPEFAAEAVARAPLAGGRGEVEAYVQGLLDDDRINGALAGRDVETVADARERGLAAGLRGRLRVAEAGGAPLLAAVRVSGLVSRAELPDTMRGLSPGGPGAVFPRVGGRHRTLDHVSADVEVRWRDLRAYAEWTRRATGLRGPAAATIPGSRATYWLAGARASSGPFSLRYNFSQGRYDEAGFRDTIHQPGLTARLAPGVSALLEYDDWRRRGPSRATLVDRSLNAVLLLEF